MKICHIGSCTSYFCNLSISLNDVLHVPSFTKNLLSLSKLLRDNSIFIQFLSSSYVIKDRLSMKELLHIQLINGLYIIPQIKSSPHALYGVRVSADVWHFSLGHPSSTTTKQILDLHDLPCTNKNVSLCHDCCTAKTHRLSFISSFSCTSLPLEIIHSYLWGPNPIVSHNGFRYYIIFIDDFLRYTWIYFLHSKDEVTNVFILFKSQIKNFLGHKIKILCTDGGMEYKPIIRAFPSILHQTSCICISTVQLWELFNMRL